MATIKVKFHPSKVKGKAGTICYQLCHRQENRQITTGMRIFPHWWNEKEREPIVVTGNENTVSAYKRQIERDLEMVRDIIRELDGSGREYTLSEVIGKFHSGKLETGMLGYLKREVSLLLDAGQFGTAHNYQRTLNSFSSFLDDIDIPLSMLNSELLCLYEKWLGKRRVKKNSSSFYMRILRAAYNKAVKERLVVQTFPFSEVYTGIAKTAKRAIKEDTILKLQQLDLSGSSALALSRDMFIFSYSTRGMAFVDMAYLKKTDVTGGMITYCRHKTGQLLALRIEPCMKMILERYMSDTWESPYVFPIITSEDPELAYRQYQNGLNYHNQKLKLLGKQIGEKLPLSSYLARHSWATAARNHNVPLSVISAGMGHTSERTTLIYLDSLDNTIIDNANNRILKKLNFMVST